jgi:hypothetical protein
MIGVDASTLAPIIERFVAIKFLYDYQHDESLTFRLNQVMRRVGLPALPPRFIGILPDARRLIAASRDELLAAPAARRAPVLAALAC